MWQRSAEQAGTNRITEPGMPKKSINETGDSLVPPSYRFKHSKQIRQIDHIMIRTGNPHELYALFTETLQLPVAWPMTSPRAGVTTDLADGPPCFEHDHRQATSHGRATQEQ